MLAVLADLIWVQTVCKGYLKTTPEGIQVLCSGAEAK